MLGGAEPLGAAVAPVGSGHVDPLPRPRPQQVHVDDQQEDEAAHEEVDIEELVVAGGNLVRDDLGHGEGQAQNHEDLAIQGGHDGLQRITET